MIALICALSLSTSFPNVKSNMKTVVTKHWIHVTSTYEFSHTYKKKKYNQNEQLQSQLIHKL